MLKPAPADFLLNSESVLWQQLAVALEAFPPIQDMGVCGTEEELQQLLLKKAAGLEDPFFHGHGTNK